MGLTQRILPLAARFRLVLKGFWGGCRYLPLRSLRFDLRDNSRTIPENQAQAPRLDLVAVNSRPAVMSAITRADRQNTGPWSSTFTFFMEGFALHGDSYGALLNGVVTSSVESCPTEASAPQPEEIYSRERRGSIAIVSSSTSAEVTGPQIEQVVRYCGNC